MHQIRMRQYCMGRLFFADKTVPFSCVLNKYLSVSIHEYMFEKKFEVSASISILGKINAPHYNIL